MCAIPFLSILRIWSMLFGCGRHLPEPLDAADDAIARAPVAAIVRVARIDEECSNLGGSHITFDVVEPTTPLRVVLLGGHGFRATGVSVGDLFVAGIAPGNVVDDVGRGWCVDAHAGHGTVVAAQPADSLDDARATLRRLRP
jgi:hypothetical protein